ncbi:MAG: hypothetical protein AAF940_05880 [Pseudomonadota bacterium]
MAKFFVHMLVLLGLSAGSALAQKTAFVPPFEAKVASGTIVPELDPIVTGSTGLSAPETPAPLNFEQCDAECQANKVGITFDD